MPLITLEEAKLHTRIDHEDEDALLLVMIGAAHAYVAQATGRTDLDTAAPPMAKQAALLVFADLYANREAQASLPLSPNKTADALLAMCRDYTGYVQ